VASLAAEKLEEHEQSQLSCEQRYQHSHRRDHGGRSAGIAEDEKAHSRMVKAYSIAREGFHFLHVTHQHFLRVLTRLSGPFHSCRSFLPLSGAPQTLAVLLSSRSSYPLDFARKGSDYSDADSIDLLAANGADKDEDDRACPHF
jgi:hypothetical protein